MSEHFEEVMLRYMSELVGTVARIADALEKPRAQRMDELVEALKAVEAASDGKGFWSEAMIKVRTILSKIEGRS